MSNTGPGVKQLGIFEEIWQLVCVSNHNFCPHFPFDAECSFTESEKSKVDWMALAGLSAFVSQYGENPSSLRQSLESPEKLLRIHLCACFYYFKLALQVLLFWGSLENL